MKYEARTRDIRVCVRPHYLARESVPEEMRFFWAYTVEISNEARHTVQLRERYWHITDERGVVTEVRGPGVVGETPTLRPGDSYSYTSGCPLATPSGVMHGHYIMVTDAGEEWQIAIPAFSLDSPHAVRAVN
jgi:ApaG protein